MNHAADYGCDEGDRKVPPLILLATGMIGGAALAVLAHVSPSHTPALDASTLIVALPFLLAGLLGVAKTTTA
jgi:hypothetical protein